MITILLAATISCADAAWIIHGIRETELGSAQQAELTLEVMRATDRNCDLTEALNAESRR